MNSASLDELVQRHEKLYAEMCRVQDFNILRDLWKLSKGCDHYRTEISKESVECRRLRHPTVKYQTLLDRYAESVQILEEYVTFALLLDR